MPERARSDVSLALLLHMHQPDYRDPRTGRPGMPWVRLHAVRGYTDVAALALETGAAVTVNVVPSLLEQLAYYAAGGTDRWEQLSRVPAEDLSEPERAFVRARFVHGHPAMRAASPRFRELAARAAELERVDELRDLQVWSNLAWMGFTARRDPGVQALIEQDRGFSHEQLLGLMDTQRRVVAEVLGRWRQLESLSTSPRCHPILPLLVNLEHSRRALPHLPADLGASFAWPEDAARQLREGRDAVESTLGCRPRGLWPSEGSLSPEVLELVAEAGFTWVGADEGLLHRSDRSGPAAVHGPWEAGPAGLRVLFRDRSLSDRVGFDYHQVPGWRAAEDLFTGAEQAVARAGGKAGVVPVILDGENPWEAYPDAGEGLLRALFGSGRLVTLDEAAAAPPLGRVSRLHTGSWINADLAVWAGEEEDFLAWRQLGLLRQAWEDAGRPEEAWPAIAAAEGSDWFWWYGPQFHTPFADFFDALFRAHLEAGWRALGLEPPQELSVPIEARPRAAHRIHLAGGGSMAHSRNPVRGGVLTRGADGGLAGRLDLPSPREALSGAVVSLVTEGGARWSWPYALAEGEEAPLVRAPALRARPGPKAGSTAPDGAPSESRVSAGPGSFGLILNSDDIRDERRFRIEIVNEEGVKWKYPEMGWVELH